ncbi:hypothetical protein ACJIZ3_005670 [Penstemon smallii]|uniref:Rho termination factor N-terminal domain-containing protein n=1 Tax=Penstemon smallii TaxID=265156 RepID=A0ABD3S5J1_9LAMI
MDLSLWDSSDYLTLSYESNYHVEDHWLCDFYFGCGRDLIEEDAMNEKSCVQVLRILLNKADEEIRELEEDIVMLQCQLAWDDEDWSKPCSAALQEKIEWLDSSIESLNKVIIKDFSVELEEPGKVPPRLHDLVKPLLENYFQVKSNQLPYTIPKVFEIIYFFETSLPTRFLFPATSEYLILVLLHNIVKSTAKKSSTKNLKEKKILNNWNSEGCCGNTSKETIPLLKPAVEAEMGRNEKEDIISRKPIANPHNDKLSVKDTSTFKRQLGKRMRNSPPKKSGRQSPAILKEAIIKVSNAMVKDSSANASIEKVGSSERDERRNADMEVISKEKVNQSRFMHEGKVTISHMKSEEMETKIAKTVKLADAILDSHLIPVKIVPEELSKTPKTRVYKHAINKNVVPRKPLVKPKRNMTNISERTMALEAQATETEDTDSDTLLVLFNHKRRRASKPKKKMENKLQGQQTQEIETVVMNEVNPNYSLKLEGQEPEKTYEPAPKIDWESSSNETLVGQEKIIKKDNCSVLCIKDVENLTLRDLKTIAKNRKLPGYYALKKEELQKQLGLEPQDLK